MAPKKKFSKQQIIDAAFDIAKAEGLDAITIRKVAQELGSSIAPIYVNFTEVDELVQEVVKKTVGISKQLLLEQNSGQPFRDIGIASLRFAKEYSMLFRDLAMKHNPHMKEHDDEMSSVIGHMKQDSDLEGFSDEELKGILFKMKVFQLGLSVMAANGLLPDDASDEKLIQILDSAAADVISGARLRKNGQLEENKD